VRSFDVLLYLVQHHGEVVDKDELMREVWRNAIVEETSLTRNSSVLRKLLGETPDEHRYIVTVPGTGYRFVAAVEAGTSGPEPEYPGNSSRFSPAAATAGTGETFGMP
jgi:DNA-binding winged helix-turn-helix (wHTH) protein